MNEDVKNSVKTIVELTNLLAEKRHAFLQHILLVSTTLFGVLIALQQKSSEWLAARLCFALALVLLGFGILLTSIALYGHIAAVSRSRDLYLAQSKNALREPRATLPVSTPSKKIFVRSETTAYVFFCFSLILLSCYAVIIAVS